MTQGIGIYADEFSRAFSKVLEQGDVTCYQISKYANIDQSYLSRLKSGEKQNPSIQTVIKIGLALAHLGHNISLFDIEILYNSVGRSILYT